MTDRTWYDQLEKLPGTVIFRLEQQVAGSAVIVPRWESCLSNKFELRKHAMQMARPRGLPNQRALLATNNDHQHRMKHWIPLLAMANNQSSDQIISHAEFNKLQKEMFDMKQQITFNPADHQPTNKKDPMFMISLKTWKPRGPTATVLSAFFATSFLCHRLSSSSSSCCT